MPYPFALLNGPAPGAARPPRTRDVRYEQATIDALQKIWAAARYPWSVRLKALLPLWLPWARRRLRLRPAVEQQLLRISPRLKQGFIVQYMNVPSTEIPKPLV